MTKTTKMQRDRVDSLQMAMPRGRETIVPNAYTPGTPDRTTSIVHQHPPEEEGGDVGAGVDAVGEEAGAAAGDEELVALVEDESH